MLRHQKCVSYCLLYRIKREVWGCRCSERLRAKTGGESIARTRWSGGMTMDVKDRNWRCPNMVNTSLKTRSLGTIGGIDGGTHTGYIHVTR